MKMDEIQVVDGWEKFARRLADSKYAVWITGSNAKMLSSEVMTTLGGRYLSMEVYPYSFREYLEVMSVPYDEVSLLATISNRNKIANPLLLRLLLKKMAESVCQPISYNRLSHVLSSVSGKITMPTVSKYIEYSEAAWLLLRLRNVSAPFAEKETACKYYFVDNGVLNLFLLGGETILLENVVALALFRRYGHDADNERVFFYNEKVEVDFYVPEDELAIQVTYSMTQSPDTFDRGVNALKKLPNVLPCRRRLVLTNDESGHVEDEHGGIDIMPVWKWLLGMPVMHPGR